MSIEKMREEFEEAFIAHQVDQFGEAYRSSARQLLKRAGEIDGKDADYIKRRRELGMYDFFWVENVWWGWQASREAVVIELPNRFDEKYQDYYDDVEGGCFNEDRYIKDAHEAIEAAGVKVKP